MLQQFTRRLSNFMKNIVFVLLLSILSQSSYAQFFTKERIANDATGGKGDIDNRRLTWGYFLGYNSYDYKFTYKEQLTDSNTDIQVEKLGGFNVGLIGDVRLTSHLNLRLEPGLTFTQRNLTFPAFDQNIFAEKDYLREVKSTYIHVPLLLKFSTNRLNNIKPFIVGGVSTSFNLSSNADNPQDNLEGQFRQKKATNYYELGVGIDLYFYYFKFTPSIRGVFAMTDELVPDNTTNSPYTGNVGSMKSRGLFLNFTFQ